MLSALLAAAYAKFESCQNARDVETAAQVAKAAKVVTDAAYETTKDKVDPQGEALQQLRDDLNVLLAERELMRQKAATSTKGTVLVVPESVPPKAVNPAAVQPLPPTAQAAAADAGVK